MPRRLLNPNALSAVPSPEDLRAALVSIWYLVSEAPITVTGDYTTTGRVALERLICTNAAANTVTLHYPAADGDEVIIKRQNAQVTIKSKVASDGSKNTIDGEDEQILGVQYDSPHLVYTDSGSEWSIV